MELSSFRSSEHYSRPFRQKRGCLRGWELTAAIAMLAVGPLAGAAHGQNASQIPQLMRRPPEGSPKPETTPALVELSVPKGTPIEVSIDGDIRIRKTGQEIQGRVTQPVYAFDKLVIPAGSEAIGHIAEIQNVSAAKRTLTALNADFTPQRKTRVEFSEIILPDGKQMSISGETTPGSGEVMQFISAGNSKKGVKSAAAKRVKQEKAQAKQQVDATLQKIKGPGKMHRLARYALAESPVRPQYIDAGSVYFVELSEPLDFGSEPETPSAAAFIGTMPPPGSIVHALLVTPLNSATTKKDAEVDAVLSQPLFDGEHHLILPEGTQLKGTVLQVRPARMLHRNGDMRLVFHQVIPPGGLQQAVDANLDAVQANKGDHVRLDSEGGAKSTDSKTRYLSTGVSVVLALTSFQNDPDAPAGAESGNSVNRAAGGATGFRLVGIAMGLAVHSQPLGMAMGAYGGGMSIYSHFIKRGRDVVFAKDTAMTLDLGARASESLSNQPKPHGAATGE